MPLRLCTMFAARSASQTSTASLTTTGFRSGTTSPAMDFIAVMLPAPSVNTTE